MDYEDEMCVNGQELNVRYSAEWNEAQKGGTTDPSWDAYWELTQDVEIEIFGEWVTAKKILSKATYDAIEGVIDCRMVAERERSY